MSFTCYLPIYNDVVSHSGTHTFYISFQNKVYTPNIFQASFFSFLFLTMESSSSKMNQSLKCNEKEEYRFDPTTHNKFKEIMSTIPRRKAAWVFDLYQYEGFWCSSFLLEGMLSAQEHFKPQPNQVIVSSAPKSGTTWLKALTFAIMTRFHVDESTNPLLTRLAHDCVLFFEMNICSSPEKLNLDIPLVATHIPYTSLPKSIINSSCKIVYICRDPERIRK